MKTKKILIVDDDQDVRDYYKTIIKNNLALPHEIVEYAAANETIQYLKENKVDIILLDYQLTDTNGISLLKYLRKLVGKFTPIVMLTGKGNETVAATAIKYGAADYLVKSKVTPPILIDAIENNIASAEKRKAIHSKKKNYGHHLHFDNQTGFINRQTFEKIAEDVLNKTIKHNKSLAMILIRIDGMTEDSSSIITKIAEVLTNSLPKKSVIARHSENEFIIIMTGHSTMANLITIANQMIANIGKVNSKINCGKLKSSIGIACYPDYNNIVLLNDYTRFFSANKTGLDLNKSKESSVDELISIYSAKLCDDNIKHEQETVTISSLIDHCQKSLERAMNTGGNRFEIFREQHYSRQYRELEIELALHEAINAGSKDLTVEYVPISLLRNKNQVGFEVQLVWKDPRLGIVKHDEFVPTAKRLNIINNLDSFLTLASTFDFSKMGDVVKNEINPCHITLGIDFALMKLNDVDLMDKLSMFVQTAKLFAHLIELQISEENFNQLNISATEVKILDKHISFQLVLQTARFDDQFFNKLSIIPVSSIKIARDIVSTVLINKSSALRARSIIQLGKELNTNVIADGIDNAEQYYFLLENGCTMGTGHYIGLPLRGNQLKEYLTSARVCC